MLKFSLLVIFLVNFVHSYTISPISDDIGKKPYNPHWDAATGSLYYVDYLRSGSNIHRYDYAEKKLYSATIDGIPMPAFIIPRAKAVNQFVVGVRTERKVRIIYWNGRDPVAKVLGQVAQVETTSKYSENFLNIAKASPRKHLYFGTNVGGICGDDGPVNASLYRYTKSDGVTRLLRNVVASSGMAWNKHANKFYYIDSCRFGIREYDWNPNTDSIRNGHVVYDFGDYAGKSEDKYKFALGMTIDNKGYLYAALYYDGVILKIDPYKNKLVQEIKIPAQIVTGVTFGGPNQNILYVTTASRALNIDTGELSRRIYQGGLVYEVRDLCAVGTKNYKACV